MTMELAKHVLSPINRDSLLNAVSKRETLHLARASPAYFDTLLTLDELDQWLDGRDHFFPAVQLTGAAMELSVADYCDEQQRIQPLQVIRLLREGATLIASRAHRQFPGLRRLCQQLQLLTGWRSQANLYLTRQGHQGFNPHFDSHEVLVLQLQGAKQFRLYAGGRETPLVSEHFEPGLYPPGELLESITLQAGDTLYIPAGVMHDAVALDGADSLHVTIGLFPVCCADVLHEVIELATEQDRRLRAMVSVDEGPFAPDILEGVARQLAQLATPERVAEAMISVREQQLERGEQNSRGALSGSDPGHNLGASAWVQVKSDQVVELQETPARRVLLGTGCWLEVAADDVATVRRLLSQGRLPASAFAGMLQGGAQSPGNKLLQGLLECNMVEIIQAADHNQP